MLDPRSMAFTAAVAAVLLGVILHITRQRAKQAAGVLLWELGAFAFASGIFLNALQGYFGFFGGDFIPIVLGNIALVYGLGLAWAGAREFRGGAPSIAIVHAGAAVAGIASVVFLVALPSVASRMIAVSLVGILFMGWGGRIMFTEPVAHLRQPMRIAAFAFFGMALLLVLRVLGLVMLAPPDSSVQPSMINGLTYLLGTATVLAVYTAAVLCANGQLLHDVHRLVSEDELTGALSRRGFNLHAPEWIAKHGKGAAALVIDMDRFKQVNDQLGHAEGDQLLKLLARTAKGFLPNDSLFARMGGDEFVVLLPQKTEARRIATELGKVFANAAVEYVRGRMQGGTPTLTIGSASLGSDLSETLHRADAALYAAKEAGRNQVAGATQMFGRDQLSIMSKTGTFPIPSFAGMVEKDAAKAAAPAASAPSAATEQAVPKAPQVPLTPLPAGRPNFDKTQMMKRVVETPEFAATTIMAEEADAANATTAAPMAFVLSKLVAQSEAAATASTSVTTPSLDLLATAKLDVPASTTAARFADVPAIAPQLSEPPTAQPPTSAPAVEVKVAGGAKPFNGDDTQSRMVMNSEQLAFMARTGEFAAADLSNAKPSVTPTTVPPEAKK